VKVFEAIQMRLLVRYDGNSAVPGNSVRRDFDGKIEPQMGRGSTVFDPEAQTRRELAEVGFTQMKTNS